MENSHTQKIDIEQMKRDMAEGTKGPWIGCNMTHEAGRVMTPEEIGEYVVASVKVGDLSKFLFVSGIHDDGLSSDICHVGNGPKGEANTRRITRIPEMEARILSDAAALAAQSAEISVLRFAQRQARSDAICEFSRNAGMKGSDIVAALPADVKRFRADSAALGFGWIDLPAFLGMPPTGGNTDGR